MSLEILTPTQFIESAYAELYAVRQIYDEAQEADAEARGHWRAVVGRYLRVHRHAWDKTAWGGYGGSAVTLRVCGQSIDRGYRYTGRSVDEADVFASLVRIYLATYPAIGDSF